MSADCLLENFPWDTKFVDNEHAKQMNWVTQDIFILFSWMLKKVC